MTAAESSAAGLDAEFCLALRLKELYPQLRRGRPEDDRWPRLRHAERQRSRAIRPSGCTSTRQSGLLQRMVRYADTPMGRMPTQIDYADYRDAGGAKTPFRWTLSRPNGRFTIQISEIRTNVPIDDARFRKPDGDVK